MQVRASLEGKLLEDAQKQLTQLRGVRPDLPALVQLTEEYSQLWKVEVESKVLADGTAEIDRLLAPGNLVNARQARMRAEALFAQYPGISKFKGLLERAQAAEDIAGEKEKKLSTHTMWEEFDTVLSEFEDQKAKGAVELPRYNLQMTIQPDGSVIPIVTIVGYAKSDEAITEYRRAVQRYLVDKAGEYLQRAQRDLQLNPRGAKSNLTKALAFPGLPDTEKKNAARFP